MVPLSTKPAQLNSTSSLPVFFAKAAMAAARPDRGSSHADFIAARQAYEAARDASKTKRR